MVRGWFASIIRAHKCSGYRRLWRSAVATPAPKARKHERNLPNEGAAMTKRFLYVAPIALAGVAFFGAPAAAAVWNGSMARDIATTTAEQTDSPLILVRGGRGGGGGGGGGGRGGGGYRGGGGGGARGGGSWAGAGGNRANFSGGNRANIS